MISPTCHPMPPEGCSWHGQARLLYWGQGDHLQMGNMLLSPFVSELLGDLHVMLSLLKGALNSHHINCVASPLVDACELVSISHGFVERHPLNCERLPQKMRHSVRLRRVTNMLIPKVS